MITDPLCCSLKETINVSVLSVVKTSIDVRASGESVRVNWKPATSIGLFSGILSVISVPDATSADSIASTAKLAGSITVTHIVSVGLDSPSS